VGVTDGSDYKVVAATGQNGVGNYVNNYDIAADAWTKSDGIPAMIVMDAAISRSGKVVAATGFNTFVSSDGISYTKAPVAGISQAIYTWGEDGENLALAGAFDVANPNGGKQPLSVQGVAYSTDAGTTFTVSSNVESSDIRYGAFPSPTTWYVSQGMWADSEEDVLVKKLGKESNRWAEYSDYHRLNSRVKVHKQTGRMVVDFNRGQPIKETNTTTGWWGGISKTTDAGKTWSQVFITNPTTDYIYFNQISCFTVDNCMAVAEGEDGQGNPLVAVYTTFDGGANWEKSFSAPNVMSMMGSVVVSGKVGWISGSGYSGRTMEGYFYKTVDGGKTFTLEQTLAGCYPMDIDFGVEFGAAACVSQSGSYSSVAFYQ
jgi:hypothetical protein